VVVFRGLRFVWGWWAEGSFSGEERGLILICFDVLVPDFAPFSPSLKRKYLKVNKNQ
jgi:hypothetical protein